MKIGLIVGSLRKDSWNRKVAEEVKKLFPEDVEAKFIEIKDLPLYNMDIDTPDEPESYKVFRENLRDCDGFIFFTPEYNRSMPAAVKNALDVGSRDPKGNPWAGKRAAVFSSSPGGFGGGMAANHALRQVFVFLDIIPIQQPEVYLSKVDTLFEGESLKEGTREFLRCAVMTLVNSIKK